MAYRFERNKINDQPELVIDGFEKGIADSPYQGIASLRNLNIKYYPQVAYVNYKQKAATLTGGTQVAYDNSDYIGSTSIAGYTITGTIAFDASSNGGENTGHTTASWSHTCTGANLILLVGCAIDTSATIVSVTYNGVALTLAKDATSGAGQRASLYYLVNPATGTNTIVVTRSAGTGTLDTTAASYTGVEQVASPIDTSASSSDTSNSASLSMTTSIAGEWFVAQTRVDGSSSLSAGTNNFARKGGAIDGQPFGLWDSNASVGAIGAKTMSWSATGTITDAVYVGVALKPASTYITGTVSKSYTTSGANRMLIVQTSLTNGVADSVTYNSVSMTRLTNAVDSNNIGQSLWYLAAPTVGANTLVVSYKNTSLSSVTLMANAISYTGVKQTGFPDNSTTNVVIPTANQNLTLTTQTANCWTLLATSCNPNTTATPDGTTRQNNTASSNQIILSDSNAVVATPSSTSRAVTFSGSVTDSTAIMVSFAPVATLTQLTSYAQSPLGLIYLLDGNGNVQKQSSVGSSTFSLLTGSPTGGASGQGIAYWNNYLIVFRSTSIDYCGDGTGDAGITSSNWNTATSWPIALTASLSLTGTPAKSAVSATLSANWTKPTGTYKATIALTGGPPNSQTISPKLTNGATTITWPEPLALAASAGTITNVTLANDTTHPTFISSNDNNLYFGNGSSIGTIAKSSNYTFDPNVSLSFSVNYSALGLPDYETVSSLSELRTNLLVGGVKKIYPWDRVSTSWQTPIPITEPIKKIINIMNNIYVFAGNKGNIYFSNGYSVAPIKKVPDSFFSSIDPQIVWGGVMAHRNKLFFQVAATDSVSGASVGAGIMSYDILTQALNFENENSPGFLLTSTSGVGNVLIDVSDTSSSQYDNYFSSWYNNGTGGIDFNDTTLYSNNEPQVETDLIPVGTFLQNTAFQSLEFKLDKPMVAGDSITVYVRKSLSDTYVVLGTTTTAVLSDIYPSFTVDDFQWLQLKVTFSCASSSSSFIRLREIRLR